MLTVFTTTDQAEAIKVRDALGQPRNHLAFTVDRPHPRADDHPAEIYDVNIIDLSQTDKYAVHSSEVAALMNAFTTLALKNSV